MVRWFKMCLKAWFIEMRMVTSHETKTYVDKREIEEEVKLVGSTIFSPHMNPKGSQRRKTKCFEKNIAELYPQMDLQWIFVNDDCIPLVGIANPELFGKHELSDFFKLKTGISGLNPDY